MLWRIYFRGGSYPATWNQMRYYGPVRSARFDHHLDPPGVQERGILHAAAGDDAIATCLAEVFQDTRMLMEGVEVEERREWWLEVVLDERSARDLSSP